MGGKVDREQARLDRARKVAMFRYQLIRDAADPELTPRQRGAMVRALASAEHPGPDGQLVRYSRDHLDRWVRAWRRGGFDALLPVSGRSPRTDAEVLDVALALKRENPDRTAAQVARILRANGGWSPSQSTLLRAFRRAGLPTRPSAKPASTVVFGRFEADRANELWVGDALHGPKVAGRKTYLFAFLDDHTRLVVGHRWGLAEDTVRLAAALRPALAARGVPAGVYVDNGSAFVDAWLLRACAKLGIKLIHSTPGRPQGRGKIERFFRTVNDGFLVELAAGTPAAAVFAALDVPDALLELNRLFTAWVEQVYHHRVHSETGQTPLNRWATSTAATPPRLPAPAALREAFLWEDHRVVTKTATVSLHGNTYQVDDPFLARRRVELVYDPFDLSRLEVRLDGRPAGTATPFQVHRHAHPKARPELPATPPPPTQIDYLDLVATSHEHDLADGINYAALLDTAAPHLSPGQTTHASTENSTAATEHAPVDNGSGDNGSGDNGSGARGLGDEQIPGQLDLTTLLPEAAPTQTEDTPR